MTIEILSPVQLDASVMNADRRQAVAEALIALMRRGHPQTASDLQAIMIGFTEEDMYIQRYNWRFAFTFRQENRFAVVSTGRMSLGAVGNSELAEIRLRKMATKNIGLLYFRLPPSDNPRSVLYRNVGGIRELDYMGEEF